MAAPQVTLHPSRAPRVPPGGVPAPGGSCKPCSLEQNREQNVLSHALNELNLIKMITQVLWGTQVLLSDMHPFPRGTKATRVTLKPRPHWVTPARHAAAPERPQLQERTTLSPGLEELCLRGA